MNKVLLNKKYKDLIAEDTQKFTEEVNFVKGKLDLSSLNNDPLLIYSKNRRNALYYILSMYYSLKHNSIHSYAVITGQTLNRQHFATGDERDVELNTKVLHSDITFISLSQYDYTNDFIENLIIDLIEQRRLNKKITVISYDVMNSGQQYINMTKKLHSYFISSGFQIKDITKGDANSFDAVKSVSTTTKGRIR